MTTTATKTKPLTIKKGDTKKPTLVPKASHALGLKGQKGWTPDSTDTTRASTLAIAIMTYRRQYRSKGIANFASQMLEPFLQQIVEKLETQGYTVAVKTVDSATGGMGYKNYCLDVSKDNVLGDTLFVAHYDTVDVDHTYSQPVYKPTYNKEKNAFVPSSTVTKAGIPERLVKTVSVKDGVAFLDMSYTENTNVGCLGADDGAGLAVMLHLLSKGVIGGYCFTTGEECGGIGAADVLKQATPFLQQYKRSIEIDRRGINEIIYSQSVGYCASEAFTEWLCTTLGMGHHPSDLGSYTDVATFAEVIPENVNIASGYIDAHRVTEQVDLVYLDELADALSRITVEQWTASPCVRKANDFGDSTPMWGGGYMDRYHQTDDAVEYSPLVSSDYKLLLNLFRQDTGFMKYVLAEGLSCAEELDAYLYNYYGVGLDGADSLLHHLAYNQ